MYGILLFRTCFVNGEIFLELFAYPRTSSTGVRKGVTMELSDNKTVVRRVLEEAMAQGNLDVIDTFFAQGVVVRYYNTPPHSHASFRKLIQQFYQAMAGHSVTIHDLIAEGDTVAVRFSYTTPMHYAQFGSNPPTGQPIQGGGTGFFHFEQGKVTEWWISFEGANWDLSGFGQ